MPITRTGSLQITPKGKQAVENYRAGLYSDANLSELEFAMLSYAQSKQWQGIPIRNCLEQYGTEGSTALEQLVEEGKLSWKVPER